MTLDLPITDTARNYGYVKWAKAHDDALRVLLGKKTTVLLVVDGQELGKKNIDWKNRRISITPTISRALPKRCKTFSLSETEGKLQVRTK